MGCTQEIKQKARVESGALKDYPLATTGGGFIYRFVTCHRLSLFPNHGRYPPTHGRVLTTSGHGLRTSKYQNLYINPPPVVAKG